MHNTCTKVTNEEGKVLYRAGDDLLNRIDKDIKIDVNGLVIEGGPSLNTDLKYVLKTFKRGATTLDKIPEELKLKQTGNPCHYEIVAISPMPKEEFIRLLKTIKLTKV